ncbi:ferredoxin [Streptomyces sp. NPDC052701]|uniref:ferredoxin n=1 Tax=Streptomyces sp. NPDC052701 TaxID=3155533 RepID=UPI0034222513
MRIQVDRERCIGSGTCVLTLPAVFTQDDEDGRVRLTEDTPAAESRVSVDHAVLTCPVSAISVEDGSSD